MAAAGICCAVAGTECLKNMLYSVSQDLFISSSFGLLSGVLSKRYIGQSRLFIFPSLIILPTMYLYYTNYNRSKDDILYTHSRSNILIISLMLITFPIGRLLL